MQVKIKLLNELAKVPVAATLGDAGFDCVATSMNIVGEQHADDKNYYHSINYIEYGLGFSIEPMPFISFDGGNSEMFYTDLRARSSASKYNLVLANGAGLIDTSYRGEVKARFKYIVQPKDLGIAMLGNGFRISVKLDLSKIYKVGDKIAQLVIRPQLNPYFEVVSELSSTERGTGGFGSTTSTGPK